VILLNCKTEDCLLELGLQEEAARGAVEVLEELLLSLLSHLSLLRGGCIGRGVKLMALRPGGGWVMTLTSSWRVLFWLTIEHPSILCTDFLCNEIELGVEIVNGIIRRWKFSFCGTISILFHREINLALNFRCWEKWVLKVQGNHDISVLGLEDCIGGVSLTTLWGLDDSLQGETLSNKLTRLLGVTKGSQIDPHSAINWLKLLGGSTWLGTWLTSRGLASLGCCFILARWKSIEVEPETLVVNDILLKLLDLSTT
jgi:hypothetical protein